MSDIHSGWATKRGAVKKSWKRRFFVLRSDDSLSYYKNEPPMGKPAGVVTLRGNVRIQLGMQVEKKISWPVGSDDSTRVAIVTKDRTYYLVFTSTEEAEEWVSELKAQIMKGYSLSAPSTTTDSTATAKVPATKDEQQKCMERLQALLALDENRICADCKDAVPAWASYNLGVFVCLTCVGYHRGLGVHISKVKSCSLDTWTDAQVQEMEKRGNEYGKLKYEANIPAGFSIPSNASPDFHSFLMDKYDKLKWGTEDEVVVASKSTKSNGVDFANFANFDDAESTSTAPQSNNNPFADPEAARNNPFFVPDAATGSSSNNGKITTDTKAAAAAPRAAPAADPFASKPATSLGSDPAADTFNPFGKQEAELSVKAAEEDPMADHQWF